MSNNLTQQKFYILCKTLEDDLDKYKSHKTYTKMAEEIARVMPFKVTYGNVRSACKTIGLEIVNSNIRTKKDVNTLYEIIGDIEDRTKALELSSLSKNEKIHDLTKRVQELEAIAGRRV